MHKILDLQGDATLIKAIAWIVQARYLRHLKQRGQIAVVLWALLWVARSSCRVSILGLGWPLRNFCERSAGGCTVAASLATRGLSCCPQTCNPLSAAGVRILTWRYSSTAFGCKRGEDGPHLLSSVGVCGKRGYELAPVWRLLHSLLRLRLLALLLLLLLHQKP